MRYKWIYGLMLLAAAACSREKAVEEDPAGTSSFLRQVTPRDSVLIADQLQYGFVLRGVADGTGIALPEFKDGKLMEGVDVVSPWAVDTLGTSGKEHPVHDIRGSIVIASFDEGEYRLPPLALRRQTPDGKVDTVWFESQLLDVKTMPVDTATFVIHDIKDQVRYPVTFRETLPWIGLGLGAVALVLLAIWLIRKFRRRKEEEAAKEPAHIRALRKLDRYRGDKFWEPEKQKAFYSGVTDTLREYIDDRYGIGAMEMTTAEIFPELKKENLPDDLYGGLKELFERADFIKFAKHIATREENAEVLPLAVKFVTSTYQHEIEEEVH